MLQEKLRRRNFEKQFAASAVEFKEEVRCLNLYFELFKLSEIFHYSVFYKKSK